MNIGQIKRFVNNGLTPINSLIDDFRAAVTDENNENSLISVQKKMYTDLLAGINSIKNSLNSIGGDYYYKPSTTLLYSSIFNYQGDYDTLYKAFEWYPKYNGIVNLRVTAYATTLITVFSYGFIPTPFMKGSNFVQALALITILGASVGSSTNVPYTSDITYGALLREFKITANETLERPIPVVKGLPLIVLLHGNNGISEYSIIGSRVKI